ncbi:monovalent cation/H+ antiporter subunit D [Jannaschia seohaensis]|uniref:Multicomponent K+:H+ antiporter subunit D n=1 Tax=Jannaschia seohaensis TaxID=475081 RepID=A0A2Y9B6R6_9RHOB|nr:monovalent cation/H+ antiporter subunit D [Jannaschia seohaensis]PWJ10202.1 multicomponent K+:H+ antiporter subunit D [Jannaschia seohaensis]SSA51775.1 multicomponent K+:H+ antiporter subunit D [Jannaschia seohaensis]
MLHWIILPVVLPALLAPLIGFVMRHDMVLARVASVAGAVLLLGVAIGLAVFAADGTTYVYRLGNWPAPFGIVLVLDRLSALMVLLTAVLALIVLIHAIATGWDARGRHFHTLYQFQLMGICGAFLTGDIFNLFVFFEVLLIASYGLMIHAGGKERIRAGLQYVVMNLAGSTLFLFALGTLYASVGTLNIADMAAKIPEIAAEDAALVRVAAILLMIVFAVKAALFPVQFWLPATYANAPAPVAALFAIMTKVGAYAIIRVHTLAFGPGVPGTENLAGTWLFPAAIVTIAVGAIGVLGARRLMPLIGFSVLGSMGTLLVAVSAFSAEAISAALYYLVHSTFAAACLFLVADLVVTRRTADSLEPAPATGQNGLFAALFFAGAIAMAGMPPLSGFLGKLLVLDAMRAPGVIGWTWTAILAGSLVTILGFARAGSALFWKSTAIPAPEAAPPAPRPASAAELAPAMTGLALLALLAAFAGPVSRYMQGTTDQLFARESYIAAVVGLEERVGEADQDADAAVQEEEG